MKHVKLFIDESVKAFPYNLIGDFLTRLRNSAQKLIAARARLRRKKTATIGDWEAIRPLLEVKIQFLQDFITKVETADTIPNFRHTNTRRNFLRLHFEGEVVSAKDVVQAMFEEAKLSSMSE